MSSDYRIYLEYHGMNHHIDLHENEKGEVNIDGRKYSIASDDKGLYESLLSHMEAFRSISDVTDKGFLLGRVERVLSGDEALSARLDAYCEAFVMAGFTGSVCIEKDGKLLLNEKYGVARDVGKDFYTASLSKQFTAAAIMQLEEKGLIDFSKSINEYLPPELQSDGWKDVTVHHLLSHQSGIHNYTEPLDAYEARCSDLTLDSILQEEKEKELEFPPGSQFNYSNTNYDLLGRIIAHVSKMPYGQYIEDSLFAPAGMDSSRVQPENEKSPDEETVRGHKFLPDSSLTESSCPDLHLIYASGGVISNAEDLVKWSRILDGETEVLSKESVEKMATPYRDNYGYGLAISKDEGRHVVCHTGGFVGFSTEFRKYPDEKTTIVVLSNNQDFQATALTGGLEEIVFDGKVEMAEPVPLTTQDFSDYQGSYQSQNFEDKIFHLEVAESGALQVFSDDSTPPHISSMFPLSNERIFIPEMGVEFERQENGEIFVYAPGRSESIDILVPIKK